MLNPIDINDELKQRLLTSLDFIGEMTKKGANVAGEQITLILQDIPKYGIASNGVIAFGFFITCIILWCFSYRFLKYARLWEKENKYHTMAEGHRGGSIAFLIAGFGIFAATIYFTKNAVIAAYAPRIYIIEWTIDKVQELQTPTNIRR